jgi:dipeptidyl aminopeptidase/acylaminoacyl peptidase
MKKLFCSVVAFSLIGFALCFSTSAQEPALKPTSTTATGTAAPATPRNITIEDYFQIRDVSQPELSPDGQWVAYAVRMRMLKEDKNEQRLWMISTRGGDSIPLTAEGVSSSHPRWSPDGKYLSFLSSRNSGKSQVWLLNRQGGEAVRLTETIQGVNDFEWSPDSTRLKTENAASLRR